VLYNIALFVHILGAIGFFVTAGITMLSVSGIRRARTVRDLQIWAGLAGSRLTRGGLGLSGAGILLAGVYMTAVVWLPVPGWLVIAFVAYFATGAAFGGFLLSRCAALAQAARALPDEEPLPDALIRRARDPLLWLMTNAVGGLLVGIVFLMTVKPDALVSLAALAIALAAGIVIGRATAATAPTGASTGGSPVGSAVSPRV
jgi:hypothetical protein